MYRRTGPPRRFRDLHALWSLRRKTGGPGDARTPGQRPNGHPAGAEGHMRFEFAPVQILYGKSSSLASSQESTSAKKYIRGQVFSPSHTQYRPIWFRTAENGRKSSSSSGNPVLGPVPDRNEFSAPSFRNPYLRAPTLPGFRRSQRFLSAQASESSARSFRLR